MLKLIPHDRYEGLDPQIAEALKNHQMVEGKAYDGANEQVEAELTDYCNGLPSPYFCLVKGLITKFISFPNFTPTYKDETDWSKVERDTKIIVKDGMGNNIHHHFARYDAEKGTVIVYDRGMSSWTCMHDTRPCDPSKCRLAKEGE